MSDIDMRTFARGAGVNMSFAPGDVIFREGDAGDCLYIIQSGSVDMSVIDHKQRTSTARVSEQAEVSVINERKFQFMVDEVPNFAKYILDAMAHRIRGMGAVLGRE